MLSIVSTKRLQQTARDWRRSECLKILSSSSSSSSSDKVIATGHHADDQIETFMMKLLRGVHISNLYPMLPRSNCYSFNNSTTSSNMSSSSKYYSFIKPLLCIDKSSIITYMNSNGHEWYEDQSNQSNDYKRNQVRLDLVPLLARYHHHHHHYQYYYRQQLLLLLD
jgi:tRNA(Ile)-lysidine synthase